MEVPALHPQPDVPKLSRPDSGEKEPVNKEDREAFDLFLEGRVAAWKTWGEPRALPTFLGMSDHTYALWFTEQLDPSEYDRLDQIWSWSIFNRWLS